MKYKYNAKNLIIQKEILYENKFKKNSLYYYSLIF